MRKYLNGIFCIMPIIMYFVVFDQNTNMVPIHFNVHGKVDAYGPKYIYLLLSCIPLFTAVLYEFGRKKMWDFESNLNVSDKLISYIIAFLSFIFMLIMYEANVGVMTHGRLIVSAFSILIILLGNLMPKLEQNRFIGIRTSSTLHSKEAWYQAHRRGGKIFFVYGIVLLILSIFVKSQFILLLGFILDLIIIVIYLAMFARKIEKKK